MKSNRMFVRRNIAKHRHYSVLSPTLPSMDVDPKGDKFFIFLAQELASLAGDITINHEGTSYATVEPALAPGQTHDGSLRLKRRNAHGEMVYTTLPKDTLVAVPVMWETSLKTAGLTDVTMDRWVRIKTKHPLVKYSR